MSTDRVQLALKLLSTIRGGPALTPDELTQLRGLTAAELSDAELLWAQGTEAIWDLQDQHAARMFYLATRRPRVLVGDAIADLTDAELDAYLELTGEDL